jgi:hypothetical protein
MPSSGYTANSFTAGQQPTTTIWNELWANDASFNSGAGFNDGIIITRHYALASISNPQILQNDANTPSSHVWVDYSGASTITGWSSYTTKIIRYMQIGKALFVNFSIAGTSNNVNTSFTLPIAAKTYTYGSNQLCVDTSSGLVIDNGAIQAGPARVYIDPTVSTQLVALVKGSGTGTFTASGNKDVRGLFTFECA